MAKHRATHKLVIIYTNNSKSEERFSSEKAAHTRRQTALKTDNVKSAEVKAID